MISLILILVYFLFEGCFVFVLFRNSTYKVVCVHIVIPVMHSSQPLLGVNLSPEFANLYFPDAGWGSFVFLLAAEAF